MRPVFSETSASLRPVPVPDTRPLAAFTSQTAQERPSVRRHAIALAITAAAHVVLIGVFLLGNLADPVPKVEKALTVTLTTDIKQPQESFVPPEVVVAQIPLTVPRPEVPVFEIAPVETPVPAQAITMPAAPTQAAPASDPNAQSNFAATLLRHLYRYKTYPARSRMRREEGVVQLQFTIDRAGRVLAYSIAKSSGHPDLDQEVLSLIQRAQPLPPIPSDIAQDPLELVLPVEFSLN